MIMKHFKAVLIVSVWTVLNIGPVVQAETPSTREYAVKAAFLYNFAKFVEWPAEAFEKDQDSLTLCILGKDPFGPALDSVSGKTVRGKSLVIQRIDKLQEIDNCDILFISRSKRNELAEVFAELDGSSVLTVGDIEGFAQRGGIINLITVERKVRFEVNLDAAEHAGLKISSKLLRLAEIVRDKKKRRGN